MYSMYRLTSMKGFLSKFCIRIGGITEIDRNQNIEQ